MMRRQKLWLMKMGKMIGVGPNTPVDVPPNTELPVEPKGVVVPNGLGANGLLLALLFCLKTD